MSQDKKLERTNRNFANFVLNHIDNNQNSKVDVNNVNFEFAAENDAQFIENNNAKNQT